jgi:hypothetical protein
MPFTDVIPWRLNHSKVPSTVVIPILPGFFDFLADDTSPIPYGSESRTPFGTSVVSILQNRRCSSQLSLMNLMNLTDPKWALPGSRMTSYQW